MGGSPFHGIFSALNQEGKGKNMFAFNQDDSNGPASVPPPAGAQQQTGSQIGRVAVDIYEQDEYYIIKAPIAGVRLSDLDIEVSDNVLTIRGSRRQTDMIPSQQYYLQECFWGPFSRSVTLPVSIDPKKVRATFNKECILKVIIPKEEKVKIVKINDA